MQKPMLLLGLSGVAAAVALALYRRRRIVAEALPAPIVELLDRAQAERRAAGHEKLIDVRALAAKAAADGADDSALRSWKYPEPPKVAGTCSRKMAAEPFDALAAARATVPGSSEEATLSRLRAIRAVCARVAEATGAHWCGIYEVVAPSDVADISRYGGDNSAPNLLKLGYIGAPSRPYFPLTAAFAEGSNNSTVAMSGRAVVYHDILALPSDAPYYTCDAQVRAEACVPIFGRGGGEVIGIMDVEAFTPDVFRPASGLGIVLAACAQLGEADLLRTPLAAAPASWEAHTCRMPKKLPPAEKAQLQQRITLADRSGYFALSCCPITSAAEQRMEQVSSVVTSETYAKQFEPGSYACARCGHLLYDGGAKFVGPCLWPSFREPRKPTGSLHTLVVPRGSYNQYACEVHELYCHGCHLFLGHAFEDGASTGDTHPQARWRHCVLSLSLKFLQA